MASVRFSCDSSASSQAQLRSSRGARERTRDRGRGNGLRGRRRSRGRGRRRGRDAARRPGRRAGGFLRRAGRRGRRAGRHRVLGRLTAALPEGRGQGRPADGRTGSRAREAHRAWRPPREAGDGRGQSASRRLDCEAVQEPRASVPRPDPGGNDRPGSRGREVRLAQGLQVFDVRDVVDPAGRRARARGQGAHHPYAGPRRREAEQDHAHRAQAPRRARPRADERGDRVRPRDDDRGGRDDSPHLADAGLAREAGGGRGGVGVRAVHRGRAHAAPRRGRRYRVPRASPCEMPRHAQLPGAPRARVALRIERRAALHARRGRPRVPGDARADPADREPGAEEAACSGGQPEAPRRGLNGATRGYPRWMLDQFREGLGAIVRQDATAYGYSLSAGGGVAILTIADRSPHAIDVFLYALGASLVFPLANVVATKGFSVRYPEAAPILIAFGTSIGFLSVAGAIFVGWLLGLLLPGWIGWLVGGFAVSASYIVLSACEVVLAHGLRRLTGVER